MVSLRTRCTAISFLTATAFILALLSLSLFCWCLLGSTFRTRFLTSVYRGRFHDNMLGIASQLLVISLPRRLDRRDQMEYLRKTLGLTWTYLEATAAEDPVVDSLISNVRHTRLNASSATFDWPEDSDSPALRPRIIMDLPIDAVDSVPLTCARDDNLIPTYTPDLPQHLLLTRSRIACWHSHLRAIHQVVISGSAAPSIILEDDIDMERDIGKKLQDVWPLLPFDWDIVFLGHCWSNETHYPPLQASSHPSHPFHLLQGLRPHFDRDDSHGHVRIHPSNAPKCTHAYALSSNGARRLWLHLTYPPFAYSRAIDQAFAWLVVSGRIKSFSIVPSVVIQRKVDASDILSGTKGSGWKDKLYNGVFKNG